MNRHDGRTFDELRQPRVTYGFLEHIPGSVLFEMGKTKVLCVVTMQNSVPPYIRGKDHGWLTAEYALMPTATLVRTPRESVTMKRSGRSVEISRLISRALRTVVHLPALGERTLVVDCDVIQADGGTRTAAITGSYLALLTAQRAWLKDKTLQKPFLKCEIAAISVSVANKGALLDPNFQEDSEGDADFNFIFTDPTTIVEVQGGAEKDPVSWDLFLKAAELAKKGAHDLFSFYTSGNFNVPVQPTLPNKPHKHTTKSEKVPLFSLINRKQMVSFQE